MLAGEISLFVAQPGHRNGALSLQEPGHRSHRVLGMGFDTHMDVIRNQMAFDDLALLLPGQLTEDFPQLTARLPEQLFASSPGHEHDMDLQFHLE
jgi:hypothetical protein